MDVHPFTYQTEFSRVPADVVGFDIEMANSFPGAPGVICMIGIERYDPAQGTAHSLIASITERDEEEDLIAWFLEQLTQFAASHRAPKLMSFSGTENDLPWIRQRMERFGLADPEESVLARYGHIDLRTEFYKRTYNRQISLKNLEKVFGIERLETISSKSVSFSLTGVMRNKAGKTIPERIFRYLRDDVHNLFVIYNRWGETSLRSLHLTEQEYMEALESLARLALKLSTSERFIRRIQGRVESLRDFAAALERGIEEIRRSRTFEGFQLPEMPEIPTRHSDLERLERKYQHLQQIRLFDPVTKAFRLKRDLFKPRGALAVVQHGGRVLMIRRSDEVQRAAGYWGLPGGVFEDGEGAEEAAERELMEELNLAGRAVRVLGTSNNLTGEYELHWVEVAVDDISTLKPHLAEVAAVEWAGPAEIYALDPLIPGAIEGFRRLLGGLWAEVPDPPPEE